MSYKIQNLTMHLAISTVYFILLLPISAKHKCLSGNCFNGKGSASFPKGDIYTGDWKNGLANGKGTLEYINGNVYIGEWEDGFANGNGLMKFKNGDLYQGEWKGSRADGLGVLYDKNGKVIYSGVWKEGKFISPVSP